MRLLCEPAVLHVCGRPFAKAASLRYEQSQSSLPRSRIRPLALVVQSREKNKASCENVLNMKI